MKKTISTKGDHISPKATEQNFPIVGIGASAGGVEAFKRFLKAIPVNSGMAYVLVQHLDPTHESILPAILAKVTKIPVIEIIDEIHLAPDNIYVIPENKTLTSIDGKLKLTPRNKIKHHLPIDIFFTSLAEVHKAYAIGVVLSGNGSDGTLGLKAIREQGGITFAQSLSSSPYPSMPNSALEMGIVDFELLPEKMPEKILQLMQIYLGEATQEDDLPPTELIVYNNILLVLLESSRVDFTHYKQTTVRRRILRRMVICEKNTLGDYLKFLKKNHEEQIFLFHDMLISVTAFFRDPKVFQNLKQFVFPALLKNKAVADPFRIWVTGCSTGEEVYTLAISLHQFLEKISGRQIQIFASDISEPSIVKARIGAYTNVELKNVSDHLLKNYFTKSSGGYQVNRQIRDMCVFAVHDMLKDPPFAKMDLISCRNVLIYMDTFLQKRALSTFHYSLKNNGFLLLGKSETTGPASELFTTFLKDDKIYLRKAVPSRFVQLYSERKDAGINEKIKKISKPVVQQNDFRKSAENILIAKFTPPSVIVNDQMDIVHINGFINAYLEPPQGKPTFNLLKMAREGLAFELRNTLHKAKASNSSAIKEGILVKSNGKILQLTIEIEPLMNGVEPHFLIVFHKTAMPEIKVTAKGKLTNEKKMNLEAHQRINQLEKEIALTREDMRAITEDQEIANEELQSANEELLSSSEELQSLNEELETSKEELQSTNEELIIINQELLDKQEQINMMRLFAEDIIATVREPLVVLDKNLCIKSINASFFKKFKLNQQEAEGKLIYEIKNGLFDNDEFRNQLDRVIPKRSNLVDYEMTIQLQLIGTCNLLLNARLVISDERNKEQFILLSIEDITERKHHELNAKRATDIAEEGKAKAEIATLLAEDAVKAKQQFLSNMSHEIRTPMNAIIGFTKVVLKTKLDIKQQEYLEAIKTSGDALIVLINDILDLAKVDAGKMTFVEAPFKLEVSITSMLHLFETKIQEKNLKLLNAYDKKIPAILLGDSMRLHQIVLNLLSNAVKFTSIGSITFNVDLVEEKKDSVSIRFQVKDTGIGIVGDKLETIFEKFQQASNATSSLYGGTGLGLAIVKELVEAQGGSIDVQSVFGEGSVFTFQLNFKKAKPNKSIKMETKLTKLDFKNIKILVVEDVRLNQLLMQTLLDDFGFGYEIAENGKIATEKLALSHFDLVLMDLQMPEMDGFEATDYIRNVMHLTIPIIALTADVMTMDLDKCNAIGMNGYLTKPIDEKLLYHKITEVLK
ncbi:MAG: chemotaxis protein CheB [bacterium]|nr:chemotaxis protein CheB [bacterium]